MTAPRLDRPGSRIWSRVLPDTAGDPVRRNAVLAAWAVFGVVLALAIWTYWRLAPGATYHFEDSGVSGAASRSVTYLNYPVAIAALALVWLLGRSVLTIVTAALCLVAFLPGVVSEDDLQARWVNVPATVGVLLAACLTIAVALRDRRGGWPLGRGGTALLVLLLVVAVPYLVAAAGFYADEVPALGFLRASQPTPGQPDLPSVHRGLHDGLFGLQLVAAAVLVSVARARLPRGLAPYLALVATYGAWIGFGDLWHEELYKAGYVDAKVPDVLRPAVTPAWGVLLLLAAVVYVVWFRWAEPARRRRGAGGA